ncbi:hypothetical protein PIB30_062490 [Stylosanthes scabra]|uniref:Uncharacterized protein n=1 Tax=Stylosanthes scabra TaxID=79078 RepID=A0ABU6SMK5_9FABA|nr:hypothetical protein [Stylosanthes scabra]
MEFPPILDEQYWPPWHGSPMRPNPSMRRKKRGRPVSTRIRNGMNIVERAEPKKCGLCREGTVAMNPIDGSTCPDGAYSDVPKDAAKSRSAPAKKSSSKVVLSPIINSTYSCPSCASGYSYPVGA